MTTLTESTVEDAALTWLESLGWNVAHGPAIAPDTPGAERGDYGAVVLERRLRDALARLNPTLPTEALDGALRKLTHLEGPTLEARNRAFHRMLVDGVTVEYRTDDGSVCGAQARVIDFDTPTNNAWLAVNQFTVVENKHERRPDVVLFVNGLPLGVIELKNPADEDATIWTAWQQLQTYKAELPTLFSMNVALLVSDGVEARIGTLTAGREWFKPWRTISGETLADSQLLQKLLNGELAVRRKRNVVQARSFAEMLEHTLRRYQNRAVEAAQVIEELIQLAQELREASARGEKLGLSEDEVAFYDALETNDSAVQVLGDETLRDIARELVRTVRDNVTIDWTLRENVRANLRRLVKRILRKHGYPPDKQERATRTVLEQAEVLSAGWAV